MRMSRVADRHRGKYYVEYKGQLHQITLSSAVGTAIGTVDVLAGYSRVKPQGLLTPQIQTGGHPPGVGI